MSGGNVSCDLVNQIGTANIDLKIFPDAPVTIKDCSLTPDEIAGSILNDILESALDIATKTSDTEVHKYEETLKKSLATKTDMSKSTAKEAEKVFFPDSVGDITNSCQLCINPSDGIRISDDKVDDLASQHPPPENDYKLFSSSKSGDKIEGLGDHGTLQDGKQHEEYATKQACPLPRMVEKKSRLTDLVKNSPQVISEYLKADEETKRKQDEWERMQESVLRVIELECIKPGEEPKVEPPQKYEPEKIALPEDDIEDDLLNVPPNKEENMEDVDLNRASTSSDNKQEGIMGDVCTIVSCPRRKKDTCCKPESTGSLQKEKRKKAGFLTKFFNSFKKGKNTSQKDVREDHK